LAGGTVFGRRSREQQHEDPASALGFRRVESVRVLLNGDRTTAEVTGIVRRYPRTISVPLRLASRLITAGVPVEVEQVGRPTSGAGAPW
jgi:hypothetical protein